MLLVIIGSIGRMLCGLVLLDFTTNNTISMIFSEKGTINEHYSVMQCRPVVSSWPIWYNQDITMNTEYVDVAHSCFLLMNVFFILVWNHHKSGADGKPRFMRRLPSDLVISWLSWACICPLPSPCVFNLKMLLTKLTSITGAATCGDS